MLRTPFIISLLALTLLCAALIFFLHRLPQLATFQTFSWVSLGFFFVITLVMYFIGEKAAQSDNKNAFINAVIGLTMFKLLLAAIIILIYNEMVQPTSKLFIVPFFGVYLIFTIFETYFMMKLGSTNK